VIGIGGHDAGRSQKVKPVEQAFLRIMRQMKQKRPEHRVTRALNDIMPKKKNEEKEQEDRNNADVYVLAAKYHNQTNHSNLPPIHPNPPPPFTTTKSTNNSQIIPKFKFTLQHSPKRGNQHYPCF